MKRNYRGILIGLLIIPLAACNLPTSADAPTATSLPPTTVSAPTTTAPPPTAIPNILAVETPIPGTMAYDFVAMLCSAQWSNNAYQLPCPGHLDETVRGYIEFSDHTVIEGMTSVEAPLLIGLPGSGQGEGVGLFGRYPAFSVQPGDIFYATIACQGDAVCDLQFALEYYDAFGNYQHTPSWRWLHKAGDGPTQISADLSPLAGQTVDLVLILRQQDELENQWGVWIQPYIARDPNAQLLPTQGTSATPQGDSDDKTPGVASGMVAMQSAPPYLNDPGTGNSTPVAVVFFNLDDGTYWWIHSSLTGHPYYQMTLTPGNYQIIAYAHGVGDVPYVAAGYTGQNPSCGQELKTVVVPPNGKVENIVIADWNWTCGGTAYRPAKPDDVPLP